MVVHIFDCTELTEQLMSIAEADKVAYTEKRHPSNTHRQHTLVSNEEKACF
jgi:hypothetical protein